MPDQNISIELAEVAISRADGGTFERFFHDFFPSLAGLEFVPLGGTKDGGADAFLDLSLHGGAKPGLFYQASVQADHRAKIRHTVKRLREFGREPTQLTYFTSQPVSHIDRVEEELSDELQVTIRIRDRKYILAHVNDSNQTIAAFRNHLAPLVSFLTQPGNVPVISPSEHVASPAVYVFLRQEVERRVGKSSLLDAVTDSLILWALEGTDPDQGIFMTEPGILSKIEATVPPAKHFIRGVIGHRLQELAKKGNPSGREVRYYGKDRKYCLPYETRQLVEAENLADEALRLRVLDHFSGRIGDLAFPFNTEEIGVLSEQALATVQATFEREGLEFAAFLREGESSHTYGSISDVADIVLGDSHWVGEARLSAKACICRCLSQAFYDSTEDERIYFSKLSHTYSLLFSLNTEPRIVDYLQTMASDFYLYVGTDILVRALSERFLKKEDQMTRNLLRMVSDAGATLVLSEPVLNELTSHLEGTDWEYNNFFAQQEQFVDENIARHASKILIRAYFHTKLEPASHEGSPSSWPNFISQFCDYAKLHEPSGRVDLKNYLIAQFNLKFEESAELYELVDDGQVAELADKLMEIKKDKKLASNDALMVLAIYGRRRHLGETSRVTGFGYKTWWLTGESRILGYTKNIVGANSGAWYIMRPEFMLNFIALSPTMAEVRHAYRSIFPTILGVRLSGRMRPDIFHKLIDRVKEASEMEEGRRRAAIEELSNRLKGDFYKQYEIEFSSN